MVATVAVEEVVVSRGAYLACVQHAHTTEGEEVMGLLVGSYGEGSSCQVSHAVVLRRSDKRSDRVEISPEMLAEAQETAEKISADCGAERHVVGWYHSHPKITVVPSAVDLRTQLSYQAMETRFVGLIFSVFNASDTTQALEHVVMGFQAVVGGEGEVVRRDLALRVELDGPYESPRGPASSLSVVCSTLEQEQLAVLESAAALCGRAPLRTAYNQAVASQRILALCEHLPGPMTVQLRAYDQWRAGSEDTIDRQIHNLESLIEEKGLTADWINFEQEIKAGLLDKDRAEESVFVDKNGGMAVDVSDSTSKPSKKTGGSVKLGVLNSETDGISNSLDIVSLDSEEF